MLSESYDSSHNVWKLLGLLAAMLGLNLQGI